MSSDPEDAVDEDLAALLAACDDDLARGNRQSSLDALRASDAIKQKRLRKKLACVDKLRRLLGSGNRGFAALPQVIGRFRILSRLGSGTFGVVYRAFDPQLGREVALKVPREDLLVTPTLRSRFQTEARAAAVLDHPNIVTLYEAGEAGPTLYIASAFCEGPALDHWLREQKEPMPADAAAGMIAALADAIQHAHERGVLHRDLKPANVLLSGVGGRDPVATSSKDNGPCLAFDPPDAIPKITDFGLAKVLSSNEVTGPGAEHQTRSDAIVGTPAYMAPEQAAGQVRAIGPAADIYSLGAILYELLTGRPPFVADSVLDMLQQVRSADPVPPARLRAKLPRDLDTICLKCLEKEPQRRYASAAELATELRRYLAGQPILARPVSSGEIFVRWVRRHPARAAFAAMSFIAALAVCGSVVGLIFNNRLEDANSQLKGANIGLETALGDARTARIGETKARLLAETALEQRERMAYLLRISRAGEERRANRFAEARRLLQDCPQARRGWEWRYLWNQTNDRALELHGHHGSVNSVAFDSQGGRIITAGSDATVRLWDASTGKEIAKIPTTDGLATFAALSPDGSRLATASNKSIRIWSVPENAEPRLLHTLTGHTGLVYRLAFHPGGHLLASTSQDQTLGVWDANTGGLLHSLRGPGFLPFGVAFSADGKTVLAAFGANTRTKAVVWEWDLETGEGRQKTQGLSVQGAPALSVRPGSAEYCAIIDGQTIQLRGKQDNVRLSIPALEKQISDVTYAPDGWSLALAHNDGSIRVVDTITTGRTLAVLPRHEGRVSSIAFDPSGQRLASAGEDGRVIIGDIISGPQGLNLHHPGFSYRFAFSGDGREIVVACQDGTVRFVDSANGKLTNRTIAASPEITRHPISALACSPMGSALAVAWKNDSNARLWVDGKPGLVLPHTQSVTAIAFSGDGKRLATASGNGVRIWDAATGREELSLAGPVPMIVGLAWHADGRRLYATGGRHPNTVETDWIWDLDNPNGLLTLGEQPQRQFFAFSILRDGRIPAFSAGRGLSAFDPSGHRPPQRFFPDGCVGGWAPHPNGQLLAVGRSGHTVAVCDTAEAFEVLSLPLERQTALTLAFDPTGRRLACIDSGFHLWIWDAPPVAFAPNLLGYSE